MKKKPNYIKRWLYVPAPIAIVLREKLKREPESKDFYKALLEKLTVDN